MKSVNLIILFLMAVLPTYARGNLHNLQQQQDKKKKEGCTYCPKEATRCPAAAQSGRCGGGWDVQTPLSFRAPR